VEEEMKEEKQEDEVETTIYAFSTSMHSARPL
jgi:hypothetical protein